MTTFRWSRRRWLASGLAAAAGAMASTAQAAESPTFGLIGPVGPQGTPQKPPAMRGRWDITQPGVYENFLVDPDFEDFDAIRVRANGTTLRNFEVRNGRQDAIEVYADDVRIESCRIHHFLAGSFQNQVDAHGITGRGARLTVRNCEISHCSGDAWQMDPGRGEWSDVVLEHCDISMGPLQKDMAGFKAGQAPGENGVDTKQSVDLPRSRLTIRNCVFHGYRASGYIGMPAALNLKDHVEVLVENCLFYDNFVAVRLRGPGSRGGAQVTLKDCWFYDCDLAIRLEDRAQALRIVRPHFGSGVKRRFQQVGGAPPGAMIDEGQDAPALTTIYQRPTT
jgi:hypothetical protein